MCVCVLVETAKSEAFRQRSGLHIEVPSVYGWQHCAAVNDRRADRQPLLCRQNPVFLVELDVLTNFLSSTKIMLFLSFLFGESHL